MTNYDTIPDALGVGRETYIEKDSPFFFGSASIVFNTEFSSSRGNSAELDSLLDQVIA